MSDNPEETTDWALKTNSGASATPPPVGTRPPLPASDSPSGADRAPDSGLLRATQRTTRRLQAIGGTKVGILGASSSGKSYLFQAMTYRASNPARSGSLRVFLGDEPADVYEALPSAEEFWMLDMRAFNEKYKKWDRLLPTNVSAQRWYKLLLRYRTGWFGRRRAEMCIDFLDGSGEAMQQKVTLMNEPTRQMFEKAYLPARVAIFCLPMWAVFPDPSMRMGLVDARKAALDGFYQILHNFKKLRQDHDIRHPVQSILALTQADDRRCAMSDVRRFWIDPFVESSVARTRELGTQSGLMRYLRDARSVSDWLLECFRRSEENDVNKLPFELQFPRDLPMIVPLSAIDGSTLDARNPLGSPTPPPPVVFPGAPPPPVRSAHPSMGIDPPDPIPVHVELPLLVALCEQHNALM